MIQLSEKERDILNVVHLEAELPIDEISKRTGYRTHTVRYHLGSMYERGVISHPLPFINVYRLGYTEFVLYFTLAPEMQTKRQAVVSLFKESPLVSWVLEISGEYQFAISICAQHVTEVSELLHSVSEKLGNVFAEKSMSVRLSFKHYGWRILSPNTETAKPVAVSSCGAYTRIDDIDEKILHCMAAGKFKSVSELSRQTLVPQTTVERRKKKLEQSGVINGYLHRIEPERLGYHCYKVLVSGKGINPELTAKMYEFCEETPEIAFFVECIGSWDYEFGITVHSPNEVSEFTSKLYERFSGEISSTRELSSIRYLKRQNYPFFLN